MGRGLAKLLAQKGANVVIVARDPKKLEAALEYISVQLPAPTARPSPGISLTESGCKSQVIPEVPLHQRRRNEARRKRPCPRRSNGMEQRPTSGRCVG